MPISASMSNGGPYNLIEGGDQFPYLCLCSLSRQSVVVHKDCERGVPLVQRIEDKALVTALHWVRIDGAFAHGLRR